MTDPKPNPSNEPHPDDDPLAGLHKMSTTAGLGTTEYVAVNGVSIVALIMGVASSLSLFDPVLLVIPLVAMILSFAAFSQIKNSNGTQTGRGLAGLGLLLSLGFLALVGGRFLQETFANRADENSIGAAIGDLNQKLHAGKYDEAYQLFDEHFTNRVNQQKFTDTWKHLVEGSKDYNGLTGMRSNGHLAFETNVDTGQKSGIGITVMDFGPHSARAYFTLLKQSDGSWKIFDIKFTDTGANLFPQEQAPGKAK